MKIYSSSTSKYDDLKFYDGKELWVKVLDIKYNWLGYIRVLATTPNTITFNSLSEDTVEGAGTTDSFTLKHQLEVLDNPPGHHYDFVRVLTTELEIVNPVEIITTEELREILTEMLNENLSNEQGRLT